MKRCVQVLQPNRHSPELKPYKIKPVSLGAVLPGLNLDKALQLAEALEDEEIVRKLQLRK
jgi:hypothetical protein